MLRPPIHSLDRSNIMLRKKALAKSNAPRTDNGGLSIGALRQIAIDLGPYDAGTCNCHHGAQAIYNACADREERVEEVPNKLLSVVPMMLHAVGLDLNTFG